MVEYKAAVSPLLMHLRNCSLALNQQKDVGWYSQSKLQLMKPSNLNAVSFINVSPGLVESHVSGQMLHGWLAMIIIMTPQSIPTVWRPHCQAYKEGIKGLEWRSNSCFCYSVTFLVFCCRIWSWSPMPCEKHGPRDSVDKNRGRRPRFLSLLRPEGHVFHTAWETMIKCYYSTLADWFFSMFYSHKYEF